VDVYAAIAAEAAARLRAQPRVLLGITGGVGVGKTTTAENVRDHLAADESVPVEVVSTDAFLLPNAELERRGLSMRKGFPQSFDTEAIEWFLRAVESGQPQVRVPVYSHATYDRVPDAVRALGPADVVIIEGVNALQRPVVDHLDLSVYVDADEDDMQAWFVDRFIELCALAREDETSFYRGFTGMSVAQQRGIADWTWREINGVNLRDHIAPSRARATWVLSKRRDHSIRAGGVPGHEAQ
jgi:type I pantothenate kinase